MAAVVNCSRRLLTARQSTTVTTVTTMTTVTAMAAAAVSATRPAASVAAVFRPAAAAAAARPFSTTASAAAKARVHVRTGKTKLIKKKKYTGTRGKPILPGERKAFRKRIVLSNGNALAVPGLQECAGASLADAACAGEVRALPDGVVDQLRAAEAFKTTQPFSLFLRPSLLVRAETVALATRLQREVAARKATLRLVIDGDRIAGKSTLLQQAMAYAFQNGFLVIHIPEAQELTSACTEYAALPGTDPVQYVQPNYTFKLLQAVQTANAALLQRLTTAHAHDDLANPVAAGRPLLELVASAKEPDHAWAVLQALWAELRDPDTALERPPVLLSLDGLAHVMRVSAYRSPAFELIHAHDLALVRLLVDALAGATAFPHGAAVLAATTRGNSPRNPTIDLALAQRRAEAALAAYNANSDAADTKGPAPTVPTPDPYFRGYDDRVAAALQSVEVLHVGGVSRPEARSLLEYWAASGLVRDRITEQAVAATWTLGGNGVVGEMERTALLSLRP